MYPGEWDQAEMAVLTTPNPAWLRSPAIQAVFRPQPPGFPGYPDPALAFPLPGEISLSQVSTALACPCRFLLENLLKIRELPEIEAGLDPRERGQLLHSVLASFVTAFREILETDQAWDDGRAREMLQEAARRALAPVSADLLWQAEADRWLGEAGLLWEWLRLERSGMRQAGAGRVPRWPSRTSGARIGLLPCEAASTAWTITRGMPTW